MRHLIILAILAALSVCGCSAPIPVCRSVCARINEVCSDFVINSYRAGVESAGTIDYSNCSAMGRDGRPFYSDEANDWPLNSSAVPNPPTCFHALTSKYAAQYKSTVAVGCLNTTVELGELPPKVAPLCAPSFPTIPMQSCTRRALLKSLETYYDGVEPYLGLVGEQCVAALSSVYCADLAPGCTAQSVATDTRTPPPTATSLPLRTLTPTRSETECRPIWEGALRAVEVTTTGYGGGVIASEGQRCSAAHIIGDEDVPTVTMWGWLCAIFAGVMLAVALVGGCCGPLLCRTCMGGSSAPRRGHRPAAGGGASVGANASADGGASKGGASPATSASALPYVSRSNETGVEARGGAQSGAISSPPGTSTGSCWHDWDTSMLLSRVFAWYGRAVGRLPVALLTAFVALCAFVVLAVFVFQIETTTEVQELLVPDGARYRKDVKLQKQIAPETEASNVFILLEVPERIGAGDVGYNAAMASALSNPRVGLTVPEGETAAQSVFAPGPVSDLITAGRLLMDLRNDAAGVFPSSMLNTAIVYFEDVEESAVPVASPVSNSSPAATLTPTAPAPIAAGSGGGSSGFSGTGQAATLTPTAPAPTAAGGGGGSSGFSGTGRRRGALRRSGIQWGLRELCGERAVPPALIEGGALVRMPCEGVFSILTCFSDGLILDPKVVADNLGQYSSYYSAFDEQAVSSDVADGEGPVGRNHSLAKLFEQYARAVNASDATGGTAAGAGGAKAAYSVEALTDFVGSLKPLLETSCPSWSSSISIPSGAVIDRNSSAGGVKVGGATIPPRAFGLIARLPDATAIAAKWEYLWSMNHTRAPLEAAGYPPPSEMSCARWEKIREGWQKSFTSVTTALRARKRLPDTAIGGVQAASATACSPFVVDCPESGGEGSVTFTGGAEAPPLNPLEAPPVALRWTQPTWLSDEDIHAVIKGANSETHIIYIAVGAIFVYLLLVLTRCRSTRTCCAGWWFKIDLHESRALVGVGVLATLCLVIASASGVVTLFGAQFTVLTMIVVPLVVLGLGLNDFLMMNRAWSPELVSRMVLAPSRAVTELEEVVGEGHPIVLRCATDLETLASAVIHSAQHDAAVIASFGDAEGRRQGGRSVGFAHAGGAGVVIRDDVDEDVEVVYAHAPRQRIVSTRTDGVESYTRVCAAMDSIRVPATVVGVSSFDVADRAGRRAEASGVRDGETSGSASGNKTTPTRSLTPPGAVGGAWGGPRGGGSGDDGRNVSAAPPRMCRIISQAAASVALAHVGPSVLLSSLTNGLGLLAAALVVDVPQLRAFTAHAGVAVLLLWVAQMFVIAPLMCLDTMWSVKRRLKNKAWADEWDFDEATKAAAAARKALSASEGGRETAQTADEGAPRKEDENAPLVGMYTDRAADGGWVMTVAAATPLRSRGLSFVAGAGGGPAGVTAAQRVHDTFRHRRASFRLGAGYGGSHIQSGGGSPLAPGAGTGAVASGGQGAGPSGDGGVYGDKLVVAGVAPHPRSPRAGMALAATDAPLSGPRASGWTVGAPSATGAEMLDRLLDLNSEADEGESDFGALPASAVYGGGGLTGSQNVRGRSVMGDSMAGVSDRASSASSAIGAHASHPAGADASVGFNGMSSTAMHSTQSIAGLSTAAVVGPKASPSGAVGSFASGVKYYVFAASPSSVNYSPSFGLDKCVASIVVGALTVWVRIKIVLGRIGGPTCIGQSTVCEAHRSLEGVPRDRPGVGIGVEVMSIEGATLLPTASGGGGGGSVVRPAPHERDVRASSVAAVAPASEPDGSLRSPLSPSIACAPPLPNPQLGSVDELCGGSRKAAGSAPASAVVSSTNGSKPRTSREPAAEGSAALDAPYTARVAALHCGGLLRLIVLVFWLIATVLGVYAVIQMDAQLPLSSFVDADHHLRQLMNARARGFQFDTYNLLWSGFDIRAETAQRVVALSAEALSCDPRSVLPVSTTGWIQRFKNDVVTIYCRSALRSGNYSLCPLSRSNPTGLCGDVDSAAGVQMVVDMAAGDGGGVPPLCALDGDRFYELLAIWLGPRSRTPTPNACPLSAADAVAMARGGVKAEDLKDEVISTPTQEPASTLWGRGTAFRSDLGVAYGIAEVPASSPSSSSSSGTASPAPMFAGGSEVATQRDVAGVFGFTELWVAVSDTGGPISQRLLLGVREALDAAADAPAEFVNEAARRLAAEAGVSGSDAVVNYSAASSFDAAYVSGPASSGSSAAVVGDGELTGQGQAIDYGMVSFNLVLTEQFLNAITSMQELIFWLLVAVSITSILLFSSPVSTAIIVIVVIGGLLNAYALFWYFGVAVNVISIVNMVFAFGMFVDATSHTVHAFLNSKGGACCAVSAAYCPDHPCSRSANAPATLCVGEAETHERFGGGEGGGNRLGGRIIRKVSVVHPEPAGSASADAASAGVGMVSAVGRAGAEESMTYIEAAHAVSCESFTPHLPAAARPCLLLQWFSCDYIAADVHTYLSHSSLTSQRSVQAVMSVIIPLIHAAVTTIVSVLPIASASMEFIRVNFSSVFMSFAVISLMSVAVTVSLLSVFGRGVRVR